MIIGLDLYSALQPMSKANHQDPKLTPGIIKMLGQDQTIVIIGQTHAAATPAANTTAYWHTPDKVIDHIDYLVAALKYHGHTVSGISLCIWYPPTTIASLRGTNRTITELHGLDPKLKNIPLRIYMHKDAALDEPTMLEDALVDWFWTSHWGAADAARNANIAVTCLPESPA